MKPLRYDTDRTVDSTDNNEYAEGLRDETAWDEEIIDTERAIDDEIPDGVDETREDERPLYDESGYDNEPAE